MTVVVLVVLSVMVAGLWWLAVLGWFESRELWNGGVCASSGQAWVVEEIDGELFLDDRHGRRMRLNFVVIHPAITDALRAQEGKRLVSCRTG